jgi:curved DNA-binding protein CbpA
MDLQDIERIFEWDALIEQSSYYEILGLLEIADTSAIRKAFHEFALTFHPDAFPEADEETAAALRRVFQRGAEAYRVLSRPESRSEYDLALATGLIRLDGTIAPAPLARPSDIRSLHDLCRSAGARLYAKRAEEAISAGDLRAAKRELQLALRADGDNAELAERLDAVDLALYAMGS